MADTSALFIVVYDDEASLCVPMGWDSDCAGALCAWSSGPVAVFSAREDARTAVRISKAWAQLNKARGKPCNEDFLGGIKFVRMLPCTTRPPVGRPG